MTWIPHITVAELLTAWKERANLFTNRVWQRSASRHQLNTNILTIILPLTFVVVVVVVVKVCCIMMWYRNQNFNRKHEWLLYSWCCSLFQLLPAVDFYKGTKKKFMKTFFSLFIIFWPHCEDSDVMFGFTSHLKSEWLLSLDVVLLVILNECRIF